MALLRACADAVLIGAGTLRATPRHRWTPGHIWPETSGFAALRRSRGRPGPELIGGHGPRRPASPPSRAARGRGHRHHGRGRPAAGRQALATSSVMVVGDGSALRPAELLAAIRARGHTCVLTEGGPRLGQLVRGGLLDELFLTVAPVLAGRADTVRPGLVAGLELLPGHSSPARLLSVRQSMSYLFLRYRLRSPERTAGGGRLV